MKRKNQQNFSEVETTVQQLSQEHIHKKYIDLTQTRKIIHKKTNFYL